MNRSRLIIGLGVAAFVALLVVAISLVSADSDDGASREEPVAIASPEPTRQSATAPPSTALPATATAQPSPDTPVSSGPAPGRTPATQPTQPAATPASPPTPPAGTVVVDAPIESVDVLIRESFPPQYGLKVVAGLPSGCARPFTHELTRAGNVIRVRVLNTTLPNAICTQIYGIYELNIDLGSGFQAGVQYSVQVNNVTKTFTAQ